MRLLEACEYAKKYGAVTVGDVILYIENHALEMFGKDSMALELRELINTAVEYCDECPIETVFKAEK